MNGKMSETEIWAEFCLRGLDLDIDEISSQLDLQPTKTWKRGTPAYRGGGPATWKDDGWRWGTRHEFSLNLPRHIEDIVELLRPRSHVVKQYVDSGMTATIEGVAEMANGETPLLVFPSHLLADISEFGLTLAFDLIFLPGQ
jgi:hypothetical protein